jgi:inosine-uridine nucleoside N-ribohydrolase
MDRRAGRIPVILDTDIGGDIDDTWALALLLRCPELDVRLVVSDTGNTEYRAAIAARLLEVAGRTDVPVGVGTRQTDQTGPQAEWVEGYRLDSYPGRLHRDGVGAIIETIESSRDPVTLIAIGPLPNIAEVLRRAPHVAPKTRFVGMHGSIRKHHDGGEGAIAEYNVKQDVKACQAAFAAPWRDLTITPLDTCGQVRLRGSRYAAIAGSGDPLLRAVIENYRIWLAGRPDTESSILFDTVAVHLAYSTAFLQMQAMNLRVTDEGLTVEDAGGVPVSVALDWTDLDGFEDSLVRRLAGSGP